MAEDENKKISHPSRDIEFTDDLKEFHTWWDVFREALESESAWIKEQKFENFLLLLKEFQPKNTKIMGRAFLKDIIEISDLRLLVLLSHLYFENFINEIIRKRLKCSQRLLDFTFNIKLEILLASKIIDEPFYTELKFINYLRNKYAHNLYFDILDYNFDNSPVIKNLKVLNKYRSKRAI